MIVLFHSNNLVVDCENYSRDIIGKNIISVILEISNSNKKSRISWIDNKYRASVNYELLDQCGVNDLYFFNPMKSEFISKEIGWIDFKSSFLNVNKSVRYATWQVSSCIGSAFGEVISNFHWNEESIDFSYFCSMLGFHALKKGVFTLSVPELINGNAFEESQNEISSNDFFMFVRSNYTTKQYCLLFIAYLLFQRKLLLFPFIRNLRFASKTRYSSNYYPNISSENTNDCTVDVIIPTLGRESYILDTLMDLNAQTLIPKRVIIVEQVSPENEKLKYRSLADVSWNFELVHFVIGDLGACNARNLALQNVTSEWSFLADDDIRIMPETLAGVIGYLHESGGSAASLASYKIGEKIDVKENPFFWSEFSSGCSIVKSNLLEGLEFRRCFEFGFGEDTDFGFQLRNSGCPVLYYNKFPVFHLKAPVGGFRTRVIRPWSNDIIDPKPEPTVSLCALMNYNRYQIQGNQLYYSLRNIGSFLFFGISIVQVKKSFSYALMLKNGTIK